MTPTKTDLKAAQKNPWGLTPHQCMTMRLLCEHGSARRVAYEMDISVKVIEHHITRARKAMGSFGSDIRIYLSWYAWTRGIK